MEPRKTRVLVVDDETSILDFVQMALEYEGYEVVAAASGSQALKAFHEQSPDLVILDWMLPDLDGPEICRQIRLGNAQIPILMLTARSQLEDRVAGLDSGADDYLCKPFKFQELQARLRALLRRTGVVAGQTLSFADLLLNLATRTVTRAGNPIELTAREFELLELLLRNPRHVLTREAILTQIWGWDYEGNANVVEVHISALRSKLGDADRKLIRTVRGTGYALGA